PLKRRAEYKRSVIEHGLESEFVNDALAQHRKLLSWMADSLKSGKYLAGDSFSNADCAVFPTFCGWSSSSSAPCVRNIPPSQTGGRACAPGPGSGKRSSIA